MRSKAEILKIATSGGGCAYYDGTVYDGEVGSIEEAMDLFAKEVAIEFMKWCANKGWVIEKLKGDTFYNKQTEELDTSDNVFNQFIKEIKQDK